MGVSYAGIPLLLTPQSSAVEYYVEKYLEYEGTRLFSWNNAYRVSGQWHSKAANVSRVNMPAFNWRAPPKIPLNTLYTPTGATRWSVGLYVLNDSQMRRIMNIVTGTGKTMQSAKLVFDTPERSETVSYNMFMLPPQPISVKNDLTDRLKDLSQSNAETWGSETLWLMPLVDGRYFWQGVTGPTTPTPITKWISLLSGLTQSLPASTYIAGPTLNVDQDYYNPDYSEFARPYHSVAGLIDAMAASIGRLPTYDPTTNMLRITQWEAPFTPFDDASIIGGGMWSRRVVGNLPSKIVVAYPCSS